MARLKRTSKFRKMIGPCPLPFNEGLEALQQSHQNKIDVGANAILCGSVSFDCLGHEYDNATRWDYGVGFEKGDECIAWIEFHPRGQSQIERIKRKREWLIDWLKTNLRKKIENFEQEFIWIPTGRGKSNEEMSPLPLSPQGLYLAAIGCKVMPKYKIN